MSVLDGVKELIIAVLVFALVRAETSYRFGLTAGSIAVTGLAYIVIVFHLWIILMSSGFFYSVVGIAGLGWMIRSMERGR